MSNHPKDEQNRLGGESSGSSTVDASVASSVVASAIEFRVTRPGAPSRRLRLSGQRYTFGSGDGCSIRLSDPTLRPMHAVLIRDAHRILVRAYSVPIQVNGVRMTEATLSPGDRLGLGGYQLELLGANQDSGVAARTSGSMMRAATTSSALEDELNNERFGEVQRLMFADVPVPGAWRGIGRDYSQQDSGLRKRAEELRRREEALQSQERAASELQQAFQARQQSLAEAHEQHLARQQEFERREAEFQQLELELRQQFEHASTQLHRSQQQATTANDAVQEMRGQFASLNEQLASLTEQHQRASEQVSQAEQELVESRRSADESNRLATRLQHQVEQLQASVAAARKETEVLQVDYENACQSIARLERMLSEQTQHGNESKESWALEADHLRQSIENVSRDLAVALTELSDVRDTNEKLAAQLEVVQRERAQLVVDLEGRVTADAWQELQRELNQANEALAATRLDHDAALGELARAREQLRLQTQAAQERDRERELERDRERELEREREREILEAQQSSSAAVASNEPKSSESVSAPHAPQWASDDAWPTYEATPVGPASHESDTTFAVDVEPLSLPSFTADTYGDAGDEDVAAVGDVAAPVDDTQRPVGDESWQNAEDWRQEDAWQTESPAFESALSPGAELGDDAYDRRTDARDAVDTEDGYDAAADLWGWQQSEGEMESLPTAGELTDELDLPAPDELGAIADRLIKNLHPYSLGSDDLDANELAAEDEENESFFEATAVNPLGFDRSGYTDDLEPSDDDAANEFTSLWDQHQYASEAEAGEEAADRDLAIDDGDVTGSRVWTGDSDSVVMDSECVVSDAVVEARAEVELPAAVTPVAPTPPASPTEEVDEDSIEAYMNRLLQRVQGVSSETTKPSASIPVTTSVTPKPTVVEEPSTTTVAAPVPEPIDPQTPMVPRSHAPERQSNLSAMRQLANESARSAISRSVKIQTRDTQLKAFTKFGSAGGLGLCALSVHFFVNFPGTPILIGAMLVIAAVWVKEGLTLLGDARRRLIQAAAAGAQEAESLPAEPAQAEPTEPHA